MSTEYREDAGRARSWLTRWWQHHENRTSVDLGAMQAVIYSANTSHRDGRMIGLMPNSDNRNSSGKESRPTSEHDAPVLSGAEVRGASPVRIGSGHGIEFTVAVVSAIVTTTSAWIAGIRMRLRIRRDLGRKATETDLTSIDTWMKVDEAEQLNARNGPLKPD
jgi:hypothetical protein